MTQLTAGSLAARRRRAVAERSATLAVGPGTGDPAGPGRAELVVLLPSADAATLLLLCEQAAELSD